MTLEQAIKKATEYLTRAGVISARLDAELLLAHIIGKDRTWIFTHVHDDLDTGNETAFQQLVDRRARREPLQYILGIQEFCGLSFKVTPDVLIPRPETELLVEAAAAFLKNASRPTIVDLCTGSGCIAVTLAKESGSARIFAADRSAQALAVARENANIHGVAGQIRFLEGDLFQPFEELDIEEQIDVITANPPYIEARELASLQPEGRDFEPEMALISGPEGTEIHQRIIARAPAFLRKNGALIMEMGIGQAEKVSAMADASGSYAKPEILKDLAGIDRVIILHRN